MLGTQSIHYVPTFAAITLTTVFYVLMFQEWLKLQSNLVVKYTCCILAELSQKHRRLSTRSSDYLPLQQTVAKKSLYDDIFTEAQNAEVCILPRLYIETIARPTVLHYTMSFYRLHAFFFGFKLITVSHSNLFCPFASL